MLRAIQITNLQTLLTIQQELEWFQNTPAWIWEQARLWLQIFGSPVQNCFYMFLLVPCLEGKVTNVKSIKPWMETPKASKFRSQPRVASKSKIRGLSFPNTIKACNIYTNGTLQPDPCNHWTCCGCHVPPPQVETWQAHLWCIPTAPFGDAAACSHTLMQPVPMHSLPWDLATVVFRHGLCQQSWHRRRECGRAKGIEKHTCQRPWWRRRCWVQKSPEAHFLWKTVSGSGSHLCELERP